jgi:hypothetical protein
MTVSGRPLPTKGLTSEPDSLAVLQAENERLVALLEATRVEWRMTPEPATSPPQPESSRLSTEAKVALFRRRFRGRRTTTSPTWSLCDMMTGVDWRRMRDGSESPRGQPEPAD